MTNSWYSARKPQNRRNYYNWWLVHGCSPILL